MLTKRLRKAGDILEIALIDHLITGDGKYTEEGEVVLIDVPKLMAVWRCSMKNNS
jgi:hypothetical protein